jgi:hypothetical protein
MVDGGHIESSHPTQRITRLAESIDIPKHRHFHTGAPGVGPALLAGRGLEKRHPRSAVSWFLWGAAYLLVGAAITFLVAWLFLS